MNAVPCSMCSSNWWPISKFVHDSCILFKMAEYFLFMRWRIISWQLLRACMTSLCLSIIINNMTQPFTQNLIPPELLDCLDFSKMYRSKEKFDTKKDFTHYFLEQTTCITRYNDQPQLVIEHKILLDRYCYFHKDKINVQDFV